MEELKKMSLVGCGRVIKALCAAVGAGIDFFYFAVRHFFF